MLALSLGRGWSCGQTQMKGRTGRFASSPFRGDAITRGSLISEGHLPEGLASELQSPLVPDLEMCPLVLPISQASAPCAKARRPLSTSRLEVDFTHLP